MTVAVRSDLASIPAYVIPRQLPDSILLNSNEAAIPPPPSVVRAITDAALSVNRYPAWFSEELVARLAGLLTVDPARITVGCGSVSLCQQLIQAVCGPGDEVLSAWRSFEAYPVLAQVVGATRRTVPLTGGHRHDLDGLLAGITDRTKVVFVCNPNNPTGTALRRAELEAFLDQVPAEVLVVLDEAYREFVTDPEVPDGLLLARDRENVAVLRTFSKAYGLAGLRIGYCVAAPVVAAAVAKVGVPFAVSRLAQAGALAALDAAEELLAACAATARERDQVRAALLSAGYEVPESQANFLWLPLGDRSAPFARYCTERGVLVRAFEGDGVRVSIGRPEENAVFVDLACGFLR